MALVTLRRSLRHCRRRCPTGLRCAASAGTRIAPYRSPRATAVAPMAARCTVISMRLPGEARYRSLTAEVSGERSVAHVGLSETADGHTACASGDDVGARAVWQRLLRHV